MKIINEQDLKVIDHKSVLDSDGFYTDYTLYSNDDYSKFKCVFGDRDIYGPESDSDFETDNYDEAQEWFDNYEGAYEDEDY